MTQKIKVLLALMFAVVLIAACSPKDTDVEDNAEDAVSENVEDGTSESEGDEVVVEDNEKVKVTFLGIEHYEDEVLNEERYEVKFEVENKQEESIEVQARSVSADGKMIDESMLSMSQEVSGGKLADAVLTITDFGEGNLPTIESELELILHIFDWDNIEYAEDIEVKIEL